MKIDRSQVELVLADATADPVSRWHVNDTFNRELVAELARAWLALDDAPEVETVGHDECDDLPIIFAPDGIETGETFRLVATSGGDGDA